MPGDEMPFGTLPAAAGTSFKHIHARDILEGRSPVAWFEVHPENYMVDGGEPHRLLGALRAAYPLSMHGVGLSLGGAGRPCPIHLDRLRALVQRYEPDSVSEHLAWSGHGGIFYNDLLPLPYDEASLRRVAANVQELQDALKRPVLVENPSRYLSFDASTIPEPCFLAELAQRTGCGLLLDINNVYVSANNIGFDPRAYLADFPLRYVAEIHLAGHAQDSCATDAETRPARGGSGGAGSAAALLVDAHDRPVADPVWRLFADVVARTGRLPSLIEWDNDLPGWPELAAEAARAERILWGEGRHAATR